LEVQPVATYSFQRVLVWDVNPGGAMRTLRNGQVSVYNAATDALLFTVTSDANGMVSFATTDVPTVYFVSPGGLVSEHITAASAIEAAAAFTVSEDAAVQALVNDTGSATRGALDGAYAPALVGGKAPARQDSLVMLASDHGVVGDGTADDGAALNTLLTTAAAAGKAVQLAAGSTVRSTVAITPPSGTRLDLNGATIKSAMPGVNDRILPISGVSNVRIWGGTIDGDKASFATATEQRHNIHIVNSSKVTLRDLVSKNAKGDGIYVGDDVSGMSSDVVLDRVTCDANWRQGLSVVAVDGLFGFACRFINTAGTAPQAGMDVEPNTDTAVVRRIKMVACDFRGNATQGLIISTRATPTVVQDGGEYIGCSFDQNTTDGIYLNNATNATFTGGTVKGNGSRGVWFSSATGGSIRNVKFLGVDVIGNAGKGFLSDQPFTRVSVVDCTITDNTGIGSDFIPVGASVGLRFVGNTTGNTGAGTSQTHGIRTGSNLSRFTSMGNVHVGNTTAATSLADDVTTRFLVDESNRLTVTGSRGGNAALAALLTGLAQRGIITDSTTA
jgi:hypothetical protein